MKSKIRFLRLAWIAGIIIVLMGATGLTVASFYLNSAAFRHKLLERMNAALNGTLTMSHHELSLISGAVELSDVVLTGPGDTRLMVLDHLRVRLFWPALVWREIRISNLAVDNLRLGLLFDQQDRLLIAQVVPPSKSPPDQPQHRKQSWQVRVDDFRLNSQAIEIQRPVKQWSGRVEQIEARADADLLQRSGRIDLDVSRLVWKSNHKDHTLERISLEAASRPGEIRPLTFKIKAAESSLSVQGAVDWTAQVPQLDLSYAFDLALAQIQSWIPKDLGLKGSAKGQGTVRGQADDPQAVLNLDLAGLQVERVPISRLKLDLHLDHRRVTLDAMHAKDFWGDVDLAGTIDLRPMFPENWFKPTAGPESLIYDLSLIGRNLKPERIPGVAMPRQGEWHIDLKAAGRGLSGSKAGGRGAITLKTRGGKAASDAQAIDGLLSAELQWADRIIDISKCVSKVGANEISAKGRIDLQTRRMEARGALEMGRLDDLGRFLGVKVPSGQGHMKINAQGDLERPHVQADLLLREVGMAEWTFGRILAEAELTPDGTVRLPRLVLENQGTFVEGRGALMLRRPEGGLNTDPAVSLNLAIQQLELSDFGPLKVPQGQLNGRLTIGGTVRQPVADLDLSESPLRWRELACLARGKAGWAQGRLTISGLNLSKGRSNLHLQADAQWQDPDSGRWLADPVVHAELKSNALHLEDLQAGYGGTVRIEADVKGPLSRIEGRFRLEGDGLDLGVQKLDALNLEGRLAEQSIRLDKLILGLAPGQEIQGRGRYGFDQRIEMVLAGHGIGVRHINALQKAYPVDGNLDLRLTAGGSLSNPELSAEMVIAKPHIDGRPLDDFHLQLGIREHQLDLDADLNFRVKVQGRTDRGDFNLAAHFKQSDLTPYLALVGGPNWSGHLSGDLQAAGNWHQPRKIKAAAALQDAAVSYQAIPLIKADQLDFNLQDGVFQLPATSVQIMKDGHLALKASGKIDGRLNAEADGRIPLVALAAFTEKLADADGDIEIHAKAGGTPEKMHWQADVTLAEIGFVVPGLTQPIQDLNGRIVVTPQTLLVESLRGTMDSGAFSLDGRIGLKAFQPTQGDLNFKAQTLPIQWPGTLDLVVSGDLNLKGRVQGARLSGQLVLVEGTYYKDVKLNLLSAITQTRRGQSVPSAYKPPEWMANIGLGVSIGYRNPFLVDNNLASLQVVPDLRVTGTLAKPVISGRAEVTEGEVIFRRKSFSVKRGVVDFVNPHKIEPTLDIQSEAQIRQWLVSLNVSGTPDALVFTLDSDPHEEDNDILSLILLGRTNRELVQGEGGGNQTTTQMLATLVATAWGEDVRRTTGMDILELETGAEDDGDSEDRVQVTVGKKLGRRLTVKYAVESNNGEMVQRAISEYRFLEHVSASGFQDSKGDYGGELLFRIEF